MSSVSEIYLLEILKGLKGMKSNAEKAIAQINDQEIHFSPDAESNSVAIIMKHIAGNMLSRFTDFLTSDGEKPDRNRDGEFIDTFKSRDELFSYWEKGWHCALQTIQSLKEEDLLRIVSIKGEEQTALRAIQRQVVHYAYHCGQIVYLCKQIRSTGFKTLSIPRAKPGATSSAPSTTAH
ncbi:MAG: DUF1572 family protein [Bacteroidia bacterium]